jgi:uncharacterized membrane protein
MKPALLVASAVAATVAASAAGVAGPAPDPIYKAEKCYGVAIAGKNDCGAQGVHSCAGEATATRDPRSWIYVPVGTCTKIEGGSTTPKAS